MTTTDYSGPFVYTDHHPDYILTAEGRLKWDDHDSLFYPEYFIKDHLGNVRVVLTTNPNFTNPTIQVTDYYPFGLEFQDVSISDNRNLYNSKELQTDAKLWWYDYGKRFYDPIIARWYVIDPKAEKYYDLTTYNYCANNPIKYIDPEGDTIVIGNFIDRTLTKIGIKTEYVRKVEMDIAQLKLSGDSEVSEMISELEGSPRIHKIIPTKSEQDGNSVSFNKDKAKMSEKQGTTINYNPDKHTTVAGDFRVPRVGLAHEMRHSYDADKGIVNFNTTSNGIPLYEVKAVKTENKVRKAIGAHRRSTYGGQDIPRGMLREDYEIK